MQFLSQYWVLIVLSLSAILFVITLWQLRDLKKRMGVFFSGRQSTDLESVIGEQIKKVGVLENTVSEILKKNEITDKMARGGIQKIGLVKFNAFYDAGGEQSFALVMLDNENSGMAITSLYGRDGARIYAKTIKAGKTEYSMSAEETKAFEQAMQK